MLKYIILLLPLVLLSPSSRAQFIVVGQACGASGLSGISTTGVPVICSGNPLVWTASGGSSSGSSAASEITLSPNCSGTSAPCIGLPAPGGCVINASTSSTSGVITFNGAFPTGVKVGMEAWVQTEQGSNVASYCATNFWDTAGNSAPNYCGVVNGTTVTITAVNQAASQVTVNQNCSTTQSFANAVFFYGFNIYSLLHTACLAGHNASKGVRISGGIYVLDNLSNSPFPACYNGDGSDVPGISGDGAANTQIFIPPWYNTTNDLGAVAVLTGGVGNAFSYLRDITFDATWTNFSANNSINRGTVFDVTSCLRADNISVIGFNWHNHGGATEIFYNGGASNADACYIRGSYFINDHRLIALSGLHFSLLDNVAFETGSIVITVGTNNGLYEVIGGHYESAGSQNGTNTSGAFQLPDGGQGISGDRLTLIGSTVCATGAGSSAVSQAETAGTIRLVGAKINTDCVNALGANASGVKFTSGTTGYFDNNIIAGNGTGNSVAVPSGVTLYQDQTTVQNTSGGAGFSGGGTNHHSETGTCTFAAATTCVVTFLQNFGSTPNIFIPPNIPTTVTTLTISAQSSTQFTVTASASNSATVGWSATL